MPYSEDDIPRERSKAIHIGDGVYLYSDSYHIWLMTWDGYRATNEIALDQHTLSTFMQIMNDVKEIEDA